jgi:hypothetical protein
VGDWVLEMGNSDLIGTYFNGTITQSGIALFTGSGNTSQAQRAAKERRERKEARQREHDAAMKVIQDKIVAQNYAQQLFDQRQGTIPEVLPKVYTGTLEQQRDKFNQDQKILVALAEQMRKYRVDHADELIQAPYYPPVSQPGSASGTLFGVSVSIKR